MGTWDSGPFGNDMAMDYVSEVVDSLMQPVNSFLEEPMIDEGFDEAFAAVAILNEIMSRCGARPWDAEAKATVDPATIVTAMVTCFDEQIDDMGPDPDFKTDQRAALVAELDRFAQAFV